MAFARRWESLGIPWCDVCESTCGAFEKRETKKLIEFGVVPPSQKWQLLLKLGFLKTKLKVLLLKMYGVTKTSILTRAISNCLFFCVMTTMLGRWFYNRELGRYTVWTPSLLKWFGCPMLESVLRSQVESSATKTRCYDRSSASTMYVQMSDGVWTLFPLLEMICLNFLVLDLYLSFERENHHGGAHAMQWLFSALEKKYTTQVHPFLRDMIRINQIINIHTLHIGTCCILMHIQLNGRKYFWSARILNSRIASWPELKELDLPSLKYWSCHL